MAKFFRRGVSRIYFLPAIAGTSPTAPEIAAGTNLTPDVGGITGFQLQNSPIPVPNLADIFTPQITGEDTVTDSALTLNDDDTSSVVRLALAKGTAGFIYLAPYGITAGKRGEKWPIKVTGFNDEWVIDNTNAKAMVGFAVTATPTQNCVNP